MNETLIRFSVAGTPLALPASAVLGVHEPVDLFPLPGLGSTVKGLGTVLGRATTIVDLEPFLSGPPAGSRCGAVETDPVLVLLSEPFLGLALWVTSAVTTVPSGPAAPAPAGPAGLLSSRGSRTGDGTILGILEPARLLQALASGGLPSPPGR
jgi:chemotaxis signal transduction protein